MPDVFFYTVFECRLVGFLNFLNFLFGWLAFFCRLVFMLFLSLVVEREYFAFNWPACQIISKLKNSSKSPP